MRQIGSMVLLLDDPNSLQGLARCEPFERQNRGHQQTRLPEGQCWSPPFSRFWQRTKKW